MALTPEQVTAQNFKNFYDEIKPYLNGYPSTGFTPVGTVISVMGNTAPKYYLACDGMVYQITSYPELANYFKQQFGSANYFGGDGTTTFAVPDLRGEFLRGTGTNSHANCGNGANVGNHQEPSQYNMWFTDTSGNTWQRMINNAAVRNSDTQINSGANGAYTQLTTNGIHEWKNENYAAYTSRPTNTSVLYCIAYKSICITVETIDERNVYSLDEKIIGQWFDGKPLYQRTYTGNLTSMTSSQSTVVDASFIPSTHSLKKASGIIKSSGTDYTEFTLDSTLGSDGGGFFVGSYSSTGLRITPQGNITWPSGGSYEITVRYTKTTD